MSLEIFVRTGPGERRVSLTNNGNLIRVLIDRTCEESKVDGVYLGHIAEINGNLNAAFVDIGLKNMGFLASVDAQRFDHSRDRPKPIGELFSEGEAVVVQVTQDPFNGKGAKLTTNFSILAFNLVITPGRLETSVSKNIIDEKEKNRLETILQTIRLTDAGFVARTRSMHVSQKVLIQEAEMLSKDWNKIKSLQNCKKAPRVLLDPPIPILGFLLALYQGKVDSIWVDDRQLFAELQRVLTSKGPELLPVLKMYDCDEDIFAMHDLNEQWEDLFSSTVQLPSGGSLIIEETAAMTVIDVNSGKRASGKHPEGSNMATNIEATKEIARQITLRNLGGQIVVDLLYQKHRAKRELIMKKFQEAIYEDRKNINLLGFTRLGMFELTRRRRGKSINQRLFRPSENLKSSITLALDALYQIKKEVRVNPGKLFRIDASPEVAKTLSSGGALDAKLSLEKQICGSIEIRTNSEKIVPEVSIITEIGMR